MDLELNQYEKHMKINKYYKKLHHIKYYVSATIIWFDFVSFGFMAYQKL